jgi:hypothetical protein
LCCPFYRITAAVALVLLGTLMYILLSTGSYLGPLKAAVEAGGGKLKCEVAHGK